MLLALALPLFLATPSFPQTTLPEVERQRLNDPLAQGTLPGEARFPQLSPDGTRVLFSQRIGVRTYLCVAEVDGSSPALTLDEVVPVLPRWSPDGVHVVYGENVAGAYALHSARADGSGAPVTLFTPSATESLEAWPPLSGPDSSVVCTADGSRVGLRTRRNGSLDLLSVPIEGGASALLDAPVIYLLASTIGDELVYLRDRTWRAIPAAGGTSLLIGHTPLASEGEVLAAPQTPFVVPATGRLVYSTSHDNLQIWSAPLDGSSAAVRIVFQPFLLHPIDVRATPDGERLVFARSSAAADELLQVVPLDGSAAPAVIATTATGGVGRFAVSPDSQRALYVDDASQVLASVNLDGTAPVTHGALGSVDERFTPDSQRIVVHTPSVGLASFAADGSDTPLTLVTLPLFRAIASFALSADSTRIVFLADLDQPFLGELYRVPTNAVAAPVKLHGTLAPGVEVNAFVLTPDGAYALADHSIPADGQGALTRSALAGPPAELELQLPYPTGTVGDVLGFDTARGRAIWVAHGDTPGVQELYGSTVGGGTPVKLNAPLVAGGDVLIARLAPGGRHAVYLADGDVDELRELYAAPSDGSGPAVKLSAAPQSLDFDFVRISPDGTRVVYRDASSILFSVAITGGAVTALGVSGPELAITADSAFVIDLTPGVALRSVPIGGGAPTLTVHANIQDFRLAPEGSRIAYRLSVPLQDQLSLWSVPASGGTPVEHSGALTTGGKVSDFSFAGPRLVFIADAFTDERFLLFSVPLDGSEPRRVLNGVLAAGGDVHAFRLAPDGARVVYLADQAVDANENLHSVPVDGSSADLRLQTADLDTSAGFWFARNGRNLVYTTPTFELRSLPSSGGSSTLLASGVGWSSLTPDGERLLVLRNQRLESVPVRGGTPVLLAEPARPLFLDLQLDGASVVYMEQDAEGVTELHSVTFRPRARQR